MIQKIWIRKKNLYLGCIDLHSCYHGNKITWLRWLFLCIFDALIKLFFLHWFVSLIHLCDDVSIYLLPLMTTCALYCFPNEVFSPTPLEGGDLGENRHSHCPSILITFSSVWSNFGASSRCVDVCASSSAGFWSTIFAVVFDVCVRSARGREINRCFDWFTIIKLSFNIFTVVLPYMVSILFFVSIIIAFYNSAYFLNSTLYPPIPSIFQKKNDVYFIFSKRYFFPFIVIWNCDQVPLPISNPKSYL